MRLLRRKKAATTVITEVSATNTSTEERYENVKSPQTDIIKGKKQSHQVFSYTDENNEYNECMDEVVSVGPPLFEIGVENGEVQQPLDVSIDSFNAEDTYDDLLFPMQQQSTTTPSHSRYSSNNKLNDSSQNMIRNVYTTSTNSLTSPSFCTSNSAQSSGNNHNVTKGGGNFRIVRRCSGGRETSGPAADPLMSSHDSSWRTNSHEDILSRSVVVVTPSKSITSSKKLSFSKKKTNRSIIIDQILDGTVRFMRKKKDDKKKSKSELKAPYCKLNHTGDCNVQSTRRRVLSNPFSLHHDNVDDDDKMSDDMKDNGEDDENNESDDAFMIAQETASIISIVTTAAATASTRTPSLVMSSKAAARDDSLKGSSSHSIWTTSNYLRTDDFEDPYEWLWSLNLVSLSAMEHRNKHLFSGPVQLNELGQWNSNLFISTEEHMIKESVRNYIKFHLSLLFPTIENMEEEHERQLDQDNKIHISNRSNTMKVEIDNLTHPVDVDSFIRTRAAQRTTDGKPSNTKAVEFCNTFTNDVIESNSLVMDFLQSNNYSSAISVLKNLLLKQEKVFQDVCRYYSSFDNKFITAETAINTTLRKLTMLCLASGRQREAIQHNTELSKRLQKYQGSNGNGSSSGMNTSLIMALQEKDEPSSHNLTHLELIIHCKVEEGLVHCCSNRVGKALKSWREAIHLIIAFDRYAKQESSSSLPRNDNLYLSVLLNNVGVLHLMSGAFQDSVRMLEESYTLQKENLRQMAEALDGEEGDAFQKGIGTNFKVGSQHQTQLENAFYQLATTISNLAVAYERDYQYERSLSLLDEALSLLESNCAETNNMVDLIERMQQRLTSDERDRVKEGKRENGRKAFDTENDDDDTVDSTRSSILFGNTDGIPENHHRRLAFAAKLTMNITDHHDFVLLGPLYKDLTIEQRVRETVSVWFGKRLTQDEEYDDYSDDDDDSLLMDEGRGDLDASMMSTIFTVGETTFTDAETLGDNVTRSIPVDLDGRNVVNAELYLNAIYQQAMKHLDNNEIDDALELFRSTLRSHRDKYGDIHHLVGTALHNIGMVSLFARRYDEALVMFQEAVNVRVAALGHDHPDVQLSMMKIAMIHLAVGNLVAARASFWDLRDTFLEVLGYKHPHLAKVMNNIGVIAHECGDTVNALRSFEVSYEYQRRFYENMKSMSSASRNKQHIAREGNNGVVGGGGIMKDRSEELAAIATANTLCNMGYVYGKYGGERLEAIHMYERALHLLLEYLPKSDRRISSIRKNIEYLLTKSNSYEYNEYYYRRDHNNNSNEPPSFRHPNPTSEKFEEDKNNSKNGIPMPPVSTSQKLAACLLPANDTIMLLNHRRSCVLEPVPNIPEDLSTIQYSESRVSSMGETYNFEATRRKEEEEEVPKIMGYNWFTTRYNNGGVGRDGTRGGGVSSNPFCLFDFF